MGKWLFDSHPIVVDRELAAVFGLNEAIVLQQINYWLNSKTAKTVNGRKWIYNSYKQWRDDNFPFWSLATVRRAIESCEKKGLIITANYNKAGFDKTKWYSIDYDAVDRGMSKRCAQNEQTSCSNCADGVVQNEQTNTRDYTEITSETTTASWPAHSAAESVQPESTSASEATPLRNNEGMDEVFNEWTNIWGWPNGIITTDLTEWVHKYGADIVQHAIKQAAETVGLKKPSKYVASILDRYDREHLITIEDIKADEQRHKQPQQNRRKQPPADPDWQLIDHFS